MPTPIYPFDVLALACNNCQVGINSILNRLDDPTIDILEFEQEMSTEPLVLAITARPGLERIRRVTFHCGGFFEYASRGPFHLMVVVVNQWGCASQNVAGP